MPKPVKAPGRMLLELERHQCRWPLDMAGPFLRFCAEPVPGEGSWCPKHRRLALRPDQLSRSDRPALEALQAGGRFGPH